MCFETLSFFLCFPFLSLLHKKLGGLPFPRSSRPCRPSLVLYGEVFLHLFYTDYFNRFSIKTSNWRIYQAKFVMEITSFTGKETAIQECLIVSVSVPQLHMCLKQSLILWRNLRLLKCLNFSRSLVSNFTPIWSCIESNMTIVWKTALKLIWNAW